EALSLSGVTISGSVEPDNQAIDVDLQLIIGGGHLNQFADGISDALFDVLGDSRFDFVELTTLSEPQSLLLSRGSTSAIGEINDDELADNVFAGTITVSGIEDDLRLRNDFDANPSDMDQIAELPVEREIVQGTMALIRVGSLPGSLENLELWYQHANIDFSEQDSVEVTVAEDVMIFAGIEGDNRSLITGRVLEGGDLSFYEVWGTDFSLGVLGDARFVAGGNVTLATEAGGKIEVGGTTEVISIGGGDITLVGSSGDGLASLRGLHFFTEDIDRLDDVSNPLDNVTRGNLDLNNNAASDSPLELQQGTLRLEHQTRLATDFNLEVQATDGSVSTIANANIARNVNIVSVTDVTDSDDAAILVFQDGNMEMGERVEENSQKIETLQFVIDAGKENTIILADGDENQIWVAGDSLFVGKAASIGSAVSHVVFGPDPKGTANSTSSNLFESGNPFNGVVSGDTEEFFNVEEKDHSIFGNVSVEAISVSDDSPIGTFESTAKGLIRNAILFDWITQIDNPDPNISDEDLTTSVITADFGKFTADLGVLFTDGKQSEKIDSSTPNIALVDNRINPRVFDLNHFQADVSENVNIQEVLKLDANTTITNQRAVGTSLALFDDGTDLVTERNAINDASLQLNTLRDQFNFNIAIGDDFAVIVRNVGELNVENVNVRGEDLNVYLETTGDDAGLIVSGEVAFISDDASTTFTRGGFIAVASEVRGVTASGAPDLNSGFQVASEGVVVASNFVILDPTLQLEVFPGGTGPSPSIVTSEFIRAAIFDGEGVTSPEFDVGPNIDLLQKVATRFGTERPGFTLSSASLVESELNFEAILSFDDGKFQHFTGDEPTLLTAQPDGFLFERGVPYTSEFLQRAGEGTFLPTEIILSRGDRVFLYSAAGEQTASTDVAEVFSAEADDVENVRVFASISPALPPTEVVVISPPVFVPVQVPVIDVSTTLENAETEELRVLFDSIERIDIYLFDISFIDANDDGEVSLEEFNDLKKKINEAEGKISDEMLALEDEGLQTSESGLLKLIEEVNSEDGASFQIDIPPTPEQLETLRDTVLKGETDIFQNGPYGIFYQTRMSGDQWQLQSEQDLFTKPIDLESTSDGVAVPDEEDGASLNEEDSADIVAAEDALVPDIREPNEDDLSANRSSRAETLQAAAIANALWLLRLKRRTQSGLAGGNEEDGEAKNFSKAARRRRRLLAKASGGFPERRL
ncbi:MAG: hypothetical protein AAF664_12585, partial [Planctomycetota bacterium]